MRFEWRMTLRYSNPAREQRRIAAVRDARCSPGNRTDFKGTATQARVARQRKARGQEPPEPEGETMSRIENIRNARVLRGGELDVVSGGQGKTVVIRVMGNTTWGDGVLGRGLTPACSVYFYYIGMRALMYS